MTRDLKYWKARIEDLRMLVECETVHPMNKALYRLALERARMDAAICEVEMFKTPAT